MWTDWVIQSQETNSLIHQWKLTSCTLYCSKISKTGFLSLWHVLIELPSRTYGGYQLYYFSESPKTHLFKIAYPVYCFTFSSPLYCRALKIFYNNVMIIKLHLCQGMCTCDLCAQCSFIHQHHCLPHQITWDFQRPFSKFFLHLGFTM